MILPDINLLLYAHDSRGANYPAASAWWQRCLDGPEPVGLAWVVILGFIRISTNPRVYAEPQSPAAACSTIAEWLTLPHYHLVDPAQGHFTRLHQNLKHLGVAGNLTTDAHLATLASESGYILHTTDADFSRFPRLKFINPLRS
jgi:uncharacterized protein